MKLANTPQTVINKKSTGTLISGVKTEVSGKGGPASLPHCSLQILQEVICTLMVGIIKSAIPAYSHLS